MKLTIDTTIFTPFMINRLTEHHNNNGHNDVKTLQSLFDFQPEVIKQVRAFVTLYGSVDKLLKNVKGEVHHYVAVKCVAPLTYNGNGQRLWLTIDERGFIQDAIDTDNGEAPYGLPHDSVNTVSIPTAEYKRLKARYKILNGK